MEIIASRDIARFLYKTALLSAKEIRKIDRHNDDMDIVTKVEDNFEYESPASKADRISDKIIVDALVKFNARLGFNIPIFTEESMDAGESIYRMGPQFSHLPKASPDKKAWVSDPIDGTLHYLHGNNRPVIILALMENGKPTVGLVLNIFTGEVAFAWLGGGAYNSTDGFDNAKQVTTRKWDGIRPVTVGLQGQYTDDQDILALSKTVDFENLKGIAKLREAYEKDQSEFRVGDYEVGAVQESFLIASGEQDLFFSDNPGTGLWDIIASDIILSEAGGGIMYADGRSIDHALFIKERRKLGHNPYIAYGDKELARVIVQDRHNFRKPLFNRGCTPQ